MNGTTQFQTPAPAGKKTWFWIVIAILVVAVLAAVYYFWSSGTPSTGPTVEDTTSAIEQDLRATNLDDLGAELGDIDKELAQ